MRYTSKVSRMIPSHPEKNGNKNSALWTLVLQCSYHFGCQQLLDSHICRTSFCPNHNGTILKKENHNLGILDTTVFQKADVSCMLLLYLPIAYPEYVCSSESCRGFDTLFLCLEGGISRRLIHSTPPTSFSQFFLFQMNKKTRTCIHIKTCTCMFSEALFIISPKEKQLKN